MLQRLFSKLLFLPVETTARELDAKVLLAHVALEKGYVVFLGPKWHVQTEALKYGDGIYLNKDHSPLSYDQLKSLFDAGVGITTLDEEGLVWHSALEYKKRIDPRVLDISLAVFTWGQRQYDTILEASPEHVEKLHIVGNPRFDILHKRYLPYIKYLAAKHPIPAADYILINTMFAAGNWNPLLYGTSSYIEHQHSRGKIVAEKDLPFYTGKVAYSSLLFDVYSSLLKSISQALPDLRFILRPHPDENHERWRKVFASTPNVHVIYSGSAIYWMLYAKALIYTGCTTGIEAWAMNKPTFRFNPLPDSEYEPSLPNKFGRSVTTEDKLIKEIRSLFEGTSATRVEIDHEYAQSYIANVFTADASVNIIRVLDCFTSDNLVQSCKISTPHEQVSQTVSPLHLIKHAFRKIKKSIKLTQEDDPVAHQIAQVRLQKFAGISMKDIEWRLSCLDTIISKVARKRLVSEVASNTFRIRNI